MSVRQDSNPGASIIDYNPLDQHCPKSLVMMETFCVQNGSHWLRVTAACLKCLWLKNWNFNFISFHFTFNLNNHMWLVATVLDSRVPETLICSFVNARLLHTEGVSLCLSFLIFSSVQLLSWVQLFVTPWTAACPASLSITIPYLIVKGKRFTRSEEKPEYILIL